MKKIFYDIINNVNIAFLIASLAGFVTKIFIKYGKNRQKFKFLADLTDLIIGCCAAIFLTPLIFSFLSIEYNENLGLGLSYILGVLGQRSVDIIIKKLSNI